VDPRAGLEDVEKRKFLTPQGLELQPIASRYTDCAIAAPLKRYRTAFTLQRQTQTLLSAAVTVGV
jgi:hypothetical protein